MTHKTLRNVVGLTSISALALALVGCGGSSSSSPVAATNQAPTNVQIAGPTNVVTLHPNLYNLSATDPDGDSVVFSTTTTGAVVTGATLMYTPPALTASPATISVVATDVRPGGGAGAASPAKTIQVVVRENRAPQFMSAASATKIPDAASNTFNWTDFQVRAQDPDSDDVQYSIPTAAIVKDNLGRTAAGCTVTINAATGFVTFKGEVPAGATSVTAEFTVKAEDMLPGSQTKLGASEVQPITLTYFNGNLPPTIVTSSLPNLPLNHYIPTTEGAAGFPVEALDPNGSIDTLEWTMTSSVPGLKLSTYSGNSTSIITDSTFVPQTSTATPIVVNLTVKDSRGLSFSRSLTIAVVNDEKPAFNAGVYQSTVSGVRFVDKSQVKDQITSQARFFPEAINWIKGTSPWVNGQGSYATKLYTTGETDHVADPKATDTEFSNLSKGGSELLKAGWAARVRFTDTEGDDVLYRVDPRSVEISSPHYPMGQDFTLKSTGGPADTYPVFPYAASSWKPTASEFPAIDAESGRIMWFPVLHEQDVYTGYDNFGSTPSGLNTFIMPTYWNFTVEAQELVWDPSTKTYVEVKDSVQKANQVGRYDYQQLKVEPNNKPWIGPLTYIPGATWSVPGAYANGVWNPTTRVAIGGGASIAESPNWYGRPSIQEPESLRYTGGSTGFDYEAANEETPAIWRWLVAQAGGNATGGRLADYEVYDPDLEVGSAASGHADAIALAMGEPTHPKADTTGNFPALKSDAVVFYNPWIDGFKDKGAFAVSWGPNRLQYLFARITASASYTFPVEVRDQYERLASQKLGINPIFGTVRYTNARWRVMYDKAAEAGAVPRGGELLDFANPGDIPTSDDENIYTFSYLPFPAKWGTGTVGTSEKDFDTAIFGGTGPASGVAANATVVSGSSGSALYSAASWITLYSDEAAQTGYHTGNPLNDQHGTFNLPDYAAAQDGSGSVTTSTWKVSGYTYANIGNPAPTNPTLTDKSATGQYVDHEVRAHVIPSNSPYLFSFDTDVEGHYTNRKSNVAAYTPENTYNYNFPTELQGSTLQLPMTPADPWHATAWTAHGWHYGLYQGEIDYQSAVAGRPIAYSAIDNNSGSDVWLTTLRFTYSWPTQVTNSNHSISETGVANSWHKGDVMQIAVPNMGANARFFFHGDGAHNDTNRSNIYGWGYLGMTASDSFLAGTPYASSPISDSEYVTSSGAANIITPTGFFLATNTPFHVPSNSIWVPNNDFGATTPTSSLNHLNLPNRTAFSPGASATQLAFKGFKGYLDTTAATYKYSKYMPAMTTPGFSRDVSVNPGFAFQSVDVVDRNTNPGIIDMAAGDQIYFLWMRQDTTTKTAWAVWDASKIVKDANQTYSATGGETRVPGFTMVDHKTTSTLPASFVNDAQVSMADGNLPGQNHGSNIDVASDPALYGDITNARGFARSQWHLAAPNVGFQPVGHTNNVRLVNPYVNMTNHRYNNNVGHFRETDASDVSYEGGVRDSAMIYAVRRHTDENGNAKAELGLAGITPGSPLLAQWYNIQLTGDPSLSGSTVNLNSGTLNDVIDAWPKCFKFYSPFYNNADWANVMELKVNFLVGMQYPTVSTDPAATIQKIPATMASVFPLGAAVTDPSCTNANHQINPGNPVIGPVQFLRVSDYKTNTVPGALQTTIDITTSNPSNPYVGGNGVVTLLGNQFIHSRSNLLVTWQANVNDQVLPSGYIVEVYQLNGTSSSTDQPIMLGSFRTGHIGDRNAVQRLFMPSMHSLSGIDGGNYAGQAAVYFFKVRSVWHKGINFETQPTKQSIPMAYCDYVSSPFVTAPGATFVAP